MGSKPPAGTAAGTAGKVRTAKNARPNRSEGERTSFPDRVRAFISAIPKGQVVGYGEVASLCGRPGAARAVVGILRVHSKLPWWRVVRSSRTLAPEVATEQWERLRKEGWRLDDAGKLTRG